MNHYDRAPIYYRFGEDTRPSLSKKQRLLIKLYDLPLIGHFFEGLLKKAFGLTQTNQIIRGFNPCTTKLTVGENSSLSNLYIHGVGPVIIGKHCSISKGNVFITGTHDLKDFNLNIVKPIIIEDYSWLTFGVTILPGVLIGRGAVIGAKSVVRKDVPPYAIVSGNPAKVIGFRYSLSEIIDFERVHFEESERIPQDELKKNFDTLYNSTQ